LVYSRQQTDLLSKAVAMLTSIDKSLKKIERQGHAHKDVREVVATVVANEQLTRKQPSKGDEKENEDDDEETSIEDLANVSKRKSDGLQSEVDLNAAEKRAKGSGSSSLASSSSSSSKKAKSAAKPAAKGRGQTKKR